MKFTLQCLEKMGMIAMADHPSELIQQMNKLGKGTVAQNRYMSKIITWLHDHMTDQEYNNTILESFLDDWFDDLNAYNIQQVLTKPSRDKTEWLTKPAKQTLKKFRKQGYAWVSGPYTTKYSVAEPKPISFDDVTELLWNLKDKQDAVEELNE